MSNLKTTKQVKHVLFKYLNGVLIECEICDNKNIAESKKTEYLQTLRLDGTVKSGLSAKVVKS